MSTAELLRAHAPSAPPELRARVLAQAPRQRRTRVRPVFVLAAAATLAIGAAVVQGVRSSAPPRNVLSLTGTTPDSAGAGKVSGAPSGATGDTFRSAAAPAASATRLQHTDASIRVRVHSTDDLGTATTRATRIATRLGGYAQSVVYRTPQGGGGASSIELRIPTAHVQHALAQLAGLGVLVSQQISIDDLTAQLVRQSEQIGQLRRRIAALNEALRNAALPESQRVLLQIKLAESKRALAQRLNGRKGTLSAGATSRVSLVLTTQKKAAAAAPRRGRLGRMLHEAAGFLAIEGLVVLFALIVASPFALAVALLWLWRRRAVDRLLME